MLLFRKLQSGYFSSCFLLSSLSFRIIRLRRKSSALVRLNGLRLNTRSFDLYALPKVKLKACSKAWTIWMYGAGLPSSFKNCPESSRDTANSPMLSIPNPLWQLGIKKVLGLSGWVLSDNRQACGKVSLSSSISDSRNRTAFLR